MRFPKATRHEHFIPHAQKESRARKARSLESSYLYKASLNGELSGHAGCLRFRQM